ncbi:MAG TPA: hemerythrin domain-containing protein [Candidatus Polarisedimenticolaceae bacterium]
MDPIDALVVEHEAALRELERLRVAATRLDQPGALADFEGALRFLETEIRAHNQWEEDHLFPKLELYFGPHGPCVVMRAEHRQLWDLYAHVGPLLDAVKGGTASAEEGAQLARVASSIVDLLVQHIAKENQILFPMAKQMLRPDDLEAMRAARPEA